MSALPASLHDNTRTAQAAAIIAVLIIIVAPLCRVPRALSTEQLSLAAKISQLNQTFAL
jgi:hypothetical protein